MNKFKKIVSGTLLVGVLVATSVTAFAAVDGGAVKEDLNPQVQLNTQTQTREHREENSHFGLGERFHRNNEEGFRKEHHGSGRGHHRNLENGERPELTEEQRALRTEELRVRASEALASGNISKEQYDGVIKDIDAGLKPMFQGRGHHGSGEFGERGNCCLTDSNQANVNKTNLK